MDADTAQAIRDLRQALAAAEVRLDLLEQRLQRRWQAERKPQAKS